MTIAIAALVKYRPERAHLLPALIEGLAPLPTTVVTDPGAHDPRARPSCWRCFRACLDAIPPDCSHVLIIEDDVTVCNDFAQGLEQIVAVRPDDLLALWVSENHGRAATEIRGHQPHRSRQCRWLRLEPNCVPVVALLFPRELAERFREWAALKPADWSEWETSYPATWRWLDDNLAVTDFIVEERLRLLAPMPSLVEHPDVEPSVLTGQPGRGRTGYRYIGPRSPLSFDWSLPERIVDLAAPA